VSEEGMLTGHISIGADMVKKKIESIQGFPEILKLKMIHIILSHHGHTEYGSPKTPQFPEAFVVYYADELDAKVDYALKLKKEARTDDPWIWTRDMGHPDFFDCFFIAPSLSPFPSFLLVKRNG
jgi:3'-5' exoribonuclease